MKTICQINWAGITYYLSDIISEDEIGISLDISEALEINHDNPILDYLDATKNIYKLIEIAE